MIDREELETNGDLWKCSGEPMPQEELDEIHCIGTEEKFDDDFFDKNHDVWYDRGMTEGIVIGRDMGYERGYEVGYEESEEDIRKYNVVLDGDFLDLIKDFSDKILSYRKPFEGGKNNDHNSMLFDLNNSLLDLTESWVMNQVWDYWTQGEEDD